MSCWKSVTRIKMQTYPLFTVSPFATNNFSTTPAFTAFNLCNFPPDLSFLSFAAFSMISSYVSNTCPIGMKQPCRTDFIHSLMMAGLSKLYSSSILYKIVRSSFTGTLVGDGQCTTLNK